MSELNELALALVSTTTVALNSTGQTTLYTVPAGKTFVPVMAILRVGADAGASVITIGQNGTADDFLDFQDLGNLNAANDMAVLKPSTPDQVDSSADKALVECLKTYAADTVIEVDVITGVGGATNYIDLFGYLV